jgi:hypothetical protein
MRHSVNIVITLWTLLFFSQSAVLVPHSYPESDIARVISESLTDPFEIISKSKSLQHDFNSFANLTFEVMVSQIVHTLSEELVVHVVILGFPEIDLNDVERCLEARSDDELSIPLITADDILEGDTQPFAKERSRMSLHPSSPRSYLQRRHITYHVTRDALLSAILSNATAVIKSKSFETVTQVLHTHYEKTYPRQIVLYVVAQQMIKCNPQTMPSFVPMGRSRDRYLIVVIDDVAEGKRSLSAAYFAHTIHSTLTGTLLPQALFHRPLLTLPTVLPFSSSSSLPLVTLELVFVTISSVPPNNYTMSLLAQTLFEVEQSVRSLPLLPSQQLVVRVVHHSFTSCASCVTAYLRARSTLATTIVAPDGNVATQLRLSLDANALRHVLRAYKSQLVASPSSATALTFPVYIFVLNDDFSKYDDEGISDEKDDEVQETIRFSHTFGDDDDFPNVRTFSELLVALWTPQHPSRTLSSSSSDILENDFCHERVLNLFEQLTLALARQWWGVTKQHIIPTSWLFPELATRVLYTHFLLYHVIYSLDSLFLHLKELRRPLTALLTMDEYATFLQRWQLLVYKMTQAHTLRGSDSIKTAQLGLKFLYSARYDIEALHRLIHSAGKRVRAYFLCDYIPAHRPTVTWVRAGVIIQSILLFCVLAAICFCRRRGKC